MDTPAYSSDRKVHAGGAAAVLVAGKYSGTAERHRTRCHSSRRRGFRLEPGVLA